MLGFIVGTSFYNYPGLKKKCVKTRFGDAEVLVGKIDKKDVAIICRHGENDSILPHQIRYRANILALQAVGVNAIVGFSVVGVMNKNYELGKIVLAHELYYPGNMLPCGHICTFFTDSEDHNNGHLIMENFYNSGLNTDIIDVVGAENYIDDATYIHFVGPRLSSKAEIRSYKNFGGDIISQTCGPEAVLSGELGILYTSACFGITYSNGILEENTSKEESDNHLEKSGAAFESIIIGLINKDTQYNFEGTIQKIN